MKPYVWSVEHGRWFMARGRDVVAVLHSDGPFPTWDEAMSAAHALIAHEPS